MLNNDLSYPGKRLTRTALTPGSSRNRNLLVQLVQQVHPAGLLPASLQLGANLRANAHANHRVPELIQRIHATLEELQLLFQRQFVVEGRLDETLGEALAAWMYGLELIVSRSGVSVGMTADGRKVQLKVTRSRKGTVGINELPESLLVLQLSGRELVELYNGPTATVWTKAGKTRKNGQRRIPVSRLRSEAQLLPADCEPQPLKRLGSPN